MKTKPKAPQNIDEYIAGFAENIQDILQKIRQTIHEAAPEAVETFKYQMPTFMLHGNLVYFAAWKQHIGFYPPISADEALKQALAVYEGPKGNLLFPLDQPIPYDLITRLVQQRIKENLKRKAMQSQFHESSE